MLCLMMNISKHEWVMDGKRDDMINDRQDDKLNDKRDDRRLRRGVAGLLLVIMVAGLSGCAGNVKDVGAKDMDAVDNGAVEETAEPVVQEDQGADEAPTDMTIMYTPDTADIDTSNADATPDKPKKTEKMPTGNDFASRKTRLQMQIDAFQAITSDMAAKYDYVEDPSDQVAMLKSMLSAATGSAELDDVAAELALAVNYVRGALFVVREGISKPDDGSDISPIEADMEAFEKAMEGIA